ncbi:MAG TPA: hypothetical protein VGK67_19345 [Myxococcales bacterium]
MKYAELPPIGRAEAANAFARGTDTEIGQALLRLSLHDPEWEWVEEQALRFADGHHGETACLSAVQALGHLARIHRRLHLEKVLPTLARLQAVPALSGRVADALEDIESFAGRKRSPRLDRHRLAEERSIAMHAAVAERIRANPALLSKALLRINDCLAAGLMHPRYAARWREILALPLDEVCGAMVNPAEEFRALRQATPFVGILDARTRWKIWREVGHGGGP